MNTVSFSLSDYLILRAAAQKYQDKHESILRHCSDASRRHTLENIINLDLAISRCDRRECSFTVDECSLMTAAVTFYRGLLPLSSESAHQIIPSLLDRLSALYQEISAENEQYRIHAQRKRDIPVSGSFQLVP